MNTPGYTRRSRSVQMLTADLQAIAGDLVLIAHGLDVQRAAQPNPLLTVPRFGGEAIHVLANAMWSAVIAGERLEEIAKERARFRSLTPAQRRELIAEGNSRKVMDVPRLDACDAPQDSHVDTSAAAD